MALHGVFVDPWRRATEGEEVDAYVPCSLLVFLVNIGDSGRCQVFLF